MDWRNLKTAYFLLSFLFITLIPVHLYAQDIALNLGGYVKNLAIRSKTILTDESYFFDITRFRLKGIVDAGSVLHTEVWFDNELQTGNFLKTLDFKFGQSFQRPTFADLDMEIVKNDDYHVRQSLFRAFTTVYLGDSEVTIGRQRVAWGTGFVWNPTDLLNPFNPAAIELEEKQGVDAVYGTLPLGMLSKIEAAFAPGRKRLKSSAALRVSSNFGSYDVAFMAGDFRDDKVIGGDFAGYIGGAGFRGEFAYTWKDAGANFLRALLNADYNFPGDIYGFVELYFNGQGASNKKNYDLTELFSGDVFNLGKNYAAVSVNKSVTPLFRTSFYSIFNLNDGSTLLGPSFSYSLATNVEIVLSAYLTTGANDSEYGQLPSSYFAYFQYFF